MKKLTIILLVSVMTLGLSITAQAFYMDFEEGLGNDLGNIVGVPGVTFTDSAGLAWVYGDSNTGNWNTRSIDLGTGSGSYQHYGNVFAWLNVTGDWGRIDFDDTTGTWFEVGITSASSFTVEAYGAGDVLLDTATLPAANTNGADMAFLKVEAGAGNQIEYVILSDSGNFWLADNMSGDARGGFPVPEPSTLLLFGTGLVGIGIFRRKFKV